MSTSRPVSASQEDQIGEGHGLRNQPRDVRVIRQIPDSVVFHIGDIVALSHALGDWS